MGTGTFLKRGKGVDNGPDREGGIANSQAIRDEEEGRAYEGRKNESGVVLVGESRKGLIKDLRLKAEYPTWGAITVRRG